MVLIMIIRRINNFFSKFEILFSTLSSYLFDADHESENRMSKFATVEKLFKVFMASDGRADGRADGRTDMIGRQVPGFTRH